MSPSKPPSLRKLSTAQDLWLRKSVVCIIHISPIILVINAIHLQSSQLCSLSLLAPAWPTAYNSQRAKNTHYSSRRRPPSPAPPRSLPRPPVPHSDSALLQARGGFLGPQPGRAVKPRMGQTDAVLLCSSCSGDSSRSVGSAAPGNTRLPALLPWTKDLWPRWLWVGTKPPWYGFSGEEVSSFALASVVCLFLPLLPLPRGKVHTRSHACTYTHAYTIGHTVEERRRSVYCSCYLPAYTMTVSGN